MKKYPHNNLFLSFILLVGMPVCSEITWPEGTYYGITGGYLPSLFAAHGLAPADYKARRCDGYTNDGDATYGYKLYPGEFIKITNAPESYIYDRYALHNISPSIHKDTWEDWGKYQLTFELYDGRKLISPNKTSNPKSVNYIGDVDYVTYDQTDGRGSAKLSKGKKLYIINEKDITFCMYFKNA